tara:strand:- start:15888 stop:16268 length:381 start_codon:yes stop_codon:yes gene_type:complete
MPCFQQTCFLIVLFSGFIFLIIGSYLFFRPGIKSTVFGCFLVLASGCVISHGVYTLINTEREASAESVLAFVSMYKHLTEDDKKIVDEMVLDDYLADGFLSKSDIDELLDVLSKMKVCLEVRCDFG